MKIPLSRTDLEAIVREMKVNGFEASSPHDPIMYFYLGSRLYLTMSEAAFRYGTIEAEYLKYQTGSQEWHATIHSARNMMWSAMYRQFPDIATRDFSAVDLIPASDKQMLKEIKQKYKNDKQ